MQPPGTVEMVKCKTPGLNAVARLKRETLELHFHLINRPQRILDYAFSCVINLHAHV
jgi:hypothetical protein